jgi:spore coat polysaccharide biosynthesis protein SpsF
MSSSRLPGKVLKPILGKPLLSLLIERALKSKLINKIVVATSYHPSDNKIEEFCRNTDVPCFRGSLEDVLDRYYKTSLYFDKPDHIVRLTGDNPLIDPEIIDKVIKFHLDNNYDYVSNTAENNFPVGLDVSVFRFQALKLSWEKACQPSEREHVNPFILGHPEIFRIGLYREKVKYPCLRWTVDTEEDFKYVKNIFEALYPQNPNFGMNDVINFLEKHSNP